MRPAILLCPLLVAACARPHVSPPNLLPTDQRPVYAVAVDDGAEVDILIHRLSVEPVRIEGNTLYFVDAPGLIERLAAIGYTPERADRLQVERRVVRVYGGNEEAIVATGARLINRENGYRIISGTLGQLQTLRRMGLRLGAIADGEPRPRQIRITVPTREDVARIGGPMHVDIWSVEAGDGRYVVTAAAFDAQIDALRASGYDVERVSPDNRPEPTRPRRRTIS